MHARFAFMSLAAYGFLHTGAAVRLERLSKILSNRGVGSRKEVDKIIAARRVTVDGVLERRAATKVSPDAAIAVDGKEVGKVPLLAAYHKPKGIITSVSDDWDRPDLSSQLDAKTLKLMHPVGRLDADTSGLLLLSSDGQLTHRLLQPRFAVEREYIATVGGSEALDGALVERLAEGVSTSDGTYAARVVHYSVEQRTVRLVVTEGKYRQVRRMLANAGFPVAELQRIRYGVVELNDLEEGALRAIEDERALDWIVKLLATAETPAAD